ncbi:MAG TPA: hypothetical protein VEY50_04210 [Lysobacter sp.]|nr:hypothetical protein [Lysobacter sp.]
MSKQHPTLALAAVLAGGLSLSGSAFAMQDLAQGYMQASHAAHDAGDKKAEGKCGADKKAGHEGKCGEGKCGEGKCGADKKGAEGKCGEGKCGADKKKAGAEGKCGEGKCGGAA